MSRHAHWPWLRAERVFGEMWLSFRISARLLMNLAPPLVVFLISSGLLVGFFY